jgi:glycosyltransferase involved in cell wall biosynthesis
MKILLVTWACDRDDVSEPYIAYRWVSEIAKRHEVVLFSVSRPDRFGCVKEQFPDLNVIEWCDIRVPAFLERFRAIAKPGYFTYFRKARNFIKQLIQENAFDLIHHLNPFAWRYASPAYGLGLPLVRGPLAGGLPTPAPLRSEVREFVHPYKFLRFSDGLRKKYDRVLHDSYHQTDCILGAAPYVIDLLKPLPVKRFEIEIEHGLDSLPPQELLKKNHDEQEMTQLLYVGRVIRTKGVRDAIRAISHMETRQNVVFSIVGDGDDLRECRELVQNLQLGDTVAFRGWCTKEQVEQAYRQADIFLFPSFREPTGGVLLEAMTHGLPCVTCDYGGPAYMVGENCGLKVPPAEPEAYARQIAAQLDLLVRNKELRWQMGQAAMQHALHNFDWNMKMTRLDAIYSSLLESR